MKTKIAAAAVICLFTPFAAYAKVKPWNNPENFEVLYKGFWSESYAPISRDELDRYGCLFYMKKDIFYKIMNDADIILKNNVSDVKAEVIISPAEKYYIDARGVSFYKNHYILINRERFEKSLINISEQKCINMHP